MEDIMNHRSRIITTSLLFIIALFAASVLAQTPKDPNAISLELPDGPIRPNSVLTLKGKQRFNNGQMQNIRFFVGSEVAPHQRVDADTVRIVVPGLPTGTHSVRVIKHDTNPG